jgi:non-specific serine/threonine protein kinase
MAALSGERSREFLLWRLTALTGLAMVEGLTGNAEGAAAHHEEVLAICRPLGESWFAGFSLWTLGVGLWRNADYDAASARLTAAIEEMRRIDYTMGTVWCVEALARVALDVGRPDRAATLIGSVKHVLTLIDAEGATLPGFSELRREYEDRTRETLGEDAYEAALAHGAGLSLDQAVAFALGTTPAPHTSTDQEGPLANLTRRETEIAALVAEGLKNSEIAARLVISPRTAEGHVQRVLVKLGLRNRSQLAAWVAAQSGPEAAP